MPKPSNDDRLIAEMRRAFDAADRQAEREWWDTLYSDGTGGACACKVSRVERVIALQPSSISQKPISATESPQDAIEPAKTGKDVD